MSDLSPQQTSLKYDREHAVKWYVDNGFELFPCGQARKDKAPRDRDWIRTIYPVSCASDLPPFFGVKPSDEFFVIDVDVKNGKKGLEQIRLLWKQLNLPKLNTLVVRTASGGAHIYFKKPPGLSLRAHIRGFNAIDIIRRTTTGKQQYVIGAGSPGYKFESLTEIAPAPQPLLDLLSQADDYVREDSRAVDDSLSNQERFARYCKETEPAVKGAGGDLITYYCALVGYDYGLSKEYTTAIMLDQFAPRCTPSIEDLPDYVESFIRRKVDNAYTYAQNQQGRRSAVDEFDDVEDDLEDVEELVGVTKKKGKIEATIANIYGYFFNSGTQFFNLVRFNIFTNEIEFTRKPFWKHEEDNSLTWSDDDAVMIKLWFSRNQGFEATTGVIYESVLAAAKRRSYHPIREYLNSLEWDGKQRLQHLYSRYAGAEDTPYVREVSQLTLIAAVSRVFDPGCKQDYMPVLEGEQGQKKGTFVEILGGKWYAVIHLRTDANGRKDTVQAMQGSWILEAAEMEFTRYDDVQAVKAFLTIKTDKIRLPYQRATSYFPRQSIFIGTVNPDASGEYLRDKTGNRRFLPISCGWMDLDSLQKDRDQLFAEAVHLYKLGHKPMLSEDAEHQARIEQEKRTISDPWLETIRNWLGEFDESPLTSEMVALYALNMSVSRLDRTASVRISTAMKACGYVHEKRWNKETKNSMWLWVKKINSEPEMEV